MIVSRKYSYSHENQWPPDSFDVHHVLVRTSWAKLLLSLGLYAPLLLACSFCIKGKSVDTCLIWSFLFPFFFLSFLVILLILRQVKKESVIVLPALGIQLETRYLSGKVAHRFVPLEKILKPVLVENVTPFTCYWSLSLIILEEEKLMLVFKELRPPLKMLVPVWQALCAATSRNDKFADAAFTDD